MTVRYDSKPHSFDDDHNTTTCHCQYITSKDSIGQRGSNFWADIMQETVLAYWPDVDNIQSEIE